MVTLDTSVLDLAPYAVTTAEASIDIAATGINQTVQCNGASVVLYNAATKNFYAVQLGDMYQPGDKLVGVMR